MENSFFVYALVSQFDGRIYVGMSQDVDRRLGEHNAGKVKSTKGFAPWMLFFVELAGNTQQARSRERYYKAASGKKKLKAILNGKVS
jgi:putative endonuclease